ncbi:MAG: SurA N-terminal domain-containing protein [Rickettsiales bacterium]|jgi:hypothetical protein|nr:SurA N-terminal domain-containing protein [Rickettsiales bacterium]
MKTRAPLVEKYKKALLILLVIALLASSVSGILFLTGKYDVATSNRGNIHVGEYMKYLDQERKAALEKYAKENPEGGENISLDMLNSPAFSEIVLQKMINIKLLEFETDYYKIKQKKELMAEKIFRELTFQTNGKFDDLKFRRYLEDMGLTENEFLNILKADDEANFLLRLFSSFGYVEDDIVGKLQNRNNVQRSATIFSKNKKDFDVKHMQYSEEELKNFYRNNGFLFEIPEMKKIDYVEIGNLSLGDAAEEALLVSDTLGELADRLGAEIKSFGYLSLNDILQENRHDLGKIFSQNTGELSPKEIVGDKIYIYAVADATDRRAEEFEQSRAKIIKELEREDREKLIIDLTKKIMADPKTPLEKHGFSAKNVNLARNSGDYSEELIQEIFQKAGGTFTEIFQDGEKIYFALVKKEINLTPESEDFITFETMYKNLADSVLNTIQEDYINYLKNVKYKIKINRKLLNMIQPGE